MAGEEEVLQKLEEELKELESEQGTSSYGSPIPEKKDNMFKFFRTLIDLKESWKVGNLNDVEIGKSDLSIRSNLEMASYLEEEGLGKVAQFFIRKAEIVSEPTMGRKGFMVQMIQTQIRKEQKLKAPEQKKRGLFGGGSKDEQTGQ